MEGLLTAVAFLAPWEFSPTVLLLCIGALALYWRGLRHARMAERPSLSRRIAFITGLLLVYFVMQTRFDYLSQHMFFIHRLQHLVLHHLGPFLIALSQPHAILADGLPARVRTKVFERFWRLPVTRFTYQLFQNAIVAPLLFVGLIWFWLTSRIHFNAMLSAPLYWVMNWSMLIDGLLFWFLMLDSRTRREGALLGFGVRIFLVLGTLVPQILIGAHITFADRDLYDVYNVCARVWDIDPLTDQQLGGLITWIPAAMMHVIAALILIGRWARSDRNKMERTSAPSTSYVGGK
ncbi:MAG: cytochrome c oxidase assembly protein [Burkholderiales bacterium]|nr:cytochrome c oxidase assembly protein [Burkholderiales bacterium]